MNILRYPCSTPPSKRATGEPSLDLDRVVWDPEYRRDAIIRLAREAAPEAAPRTPE